MKTETTSILLIEDNPGDIRLMKEMLKGVPSFSYQIITAENLKDGCAQLRSTKFDIILLDLNLPDSAGKETFDTIIQINKDIPIVLISGLNDVELSLQLIKEGAQDYITKGELNSALLSKSITYSVERKKTVDALQESRALLFSSFNNSPLLMTISDFATGSYLEVNDSFCSVSGYSRAEVIGKSAVELGWISEAERTRLTKALHNSGKVIGIELNLKTKNGMDITCRYSGDVIETVGGRRLLSTAEDITQLRSAERALHESEDKFQRITSSAPAVLFDYISYPNGSNTLLNVSSNCSEILELNRNDLLSDSNLFWRIIYKEDFVKLQEVQKRAIQEGTFFSSEVRILTRSGLLKWIQLSMRPFSASPDQSSIWSGFILDITERKRMKALLMESEQKYRLLFENMEEGFSLNEVILDDKGKAVDFRIVNANVNYEKNTGLKTDQIIGKTICEIMPNADLKQIEAYGRVALSGQHLDYEYYSKTFDRYFKVKAFCPQHGFFATVFEDITDRKRTEEKIEASEKLYRSLFDSMNGFAYCEMLYEKEIPVDFRYIMVNKAFESQTGMKDVCGKRISDLLPGIRESKPQVLEVFGRVATTGDCEQFEVFMDELKCWYSVSVSSPQKNFFLAIFEVINERKNAQELLRVSEEKYHQLVDRISIGVYVLRSKPNGEFNFQYVSPKMEEIINEKAENIIKDFRYAFRAFHPDDLEKFVKINSECIEKKKGGRYTGKLLIDGKIKWIIIDSIPVPQENGDVHWHGTMTEITEIKQAETAIAKSETRFKTLFEKAIDGILIMNSKGEIISINESFAAMHGYSVAELLKKNLRTLETPAMKKLLPEKIAEVMKGNTIHLEVDHYHKQGHIVSFSVSSSLIKIDEESYIQAFHKDITERLKAEEKLRASEARLKAAQTVSKVGSWETDLSDWSVIWSEETYRIFDLDSGAFQASHPAFMNFVHPEDKAKVDTAFSDSFQNNRINTLEHRIITGNGNIKFVEERWQVFSDNKGKPIKAVGTCQDITQRKTIEKDFVKLNRQLRELAVHMQNVREEERLHLSQELHDEMGQQLTALKMDLIWIKKNLRDTLPPVKEKITESVAMVDQAVDSIRRINGELRPIVLDELGLFAAIDWQTKQFSKHSGISCHLKFNTSEPHYKKDYAINIFRIIQEALNNTAKHSNAKAVRIKIDRKQDDLVFTIRDNGKGFIPNLDKTRDSFGLIGIKERVLMMNGTVKVDSTPGKGTKVEVTVPVAAFPVNAKNEIAGKTKQE